MSRRSQANSGSHITRREHREVPTSQSPPLPYLDDAALIQSIERLRWQLDRAESWVTNADGKATVLLGMNGVVIAGLLSVDSEVVANFLDLGWGVQGLAALFIVTVGYSSLQAARAVLPNLGKPKSGGSIFHFGDVDQMTLADFGGLSREMTPELQMQGLEHQVHTVSRIAAAKFRRIRRSTEALVMLLVLGLIMFFVHHLFR